MRYISICSGIEAATVAWHSLGWEPVAFAEIEPFPNAVLAHHYPNVPNLGDISKVDWRNYAGTVDLVVGGTPCQSFSVAGKREGLDGASGLVREYFRLLEEVRPRWFVWENVPGSLSSGSGNDFAFILRQWEKCGYHVAWRVLDAQFFGVPQRRRRVFAVGHLGGWQYPAAVLFESESLRGDITPSRKAGKENSRGVESRAYAASSFAGYKRGVGTLRASGDGSETLIAKCLTSSNQRLDWERETFVLNDQGGGDRHAVATLNSLTPWDRTQYRITDANGVHPTLNAWEGGGYHGINVFDRRAVMCAPVAPTIEASGPPYSRTGNDRVEADALVGMETAVRRLTPVEVERLMGFEDNYTNIMFKGKPAPDGPRYKALGNSMAVPCMKWIGERIQIVEDICQ